MARNRVLRALGDKTIQPDATQVTARRSYFTPSTSFATTPCRTHSGERACVQRPGILKSSALVPVRCFCGELWDVFLIIVSVWAAGSHALPMDRLFLELLCNRNDIRRDSSIKTTSNTLTKIRTSPRGSQKIVTKRGLLSG
jgi:hypothetical protein